MSCKFQVGDRVLYWPRGWEKPIGTAGTVITCYIGNEYNILWDGVTEGFSVPYLDTYLILIENGVDKLDDIL